jgi:hypothetical protein
MFKNSKYANQTKKMRNKKLLNYELDFINVGRRKLYT